MVQPDDVRGVDVIQETVEAITDQDRWVPGPSIVFGKKGSRRLLLRRGYEDSSFYFQT